MLPLEFWMVVTSLLFSAVYGIARIRHGIGLPLLAVIATVTFWYIGDVVYNDYPNNHVQKFTPQILASAWMQVFIFTICLSLFSVLLHKYVNHDCLSNTSRIYQLYREGAKSEALQSTISLFAKICVSIWVLLIALAAVNAGEKSIRFMFPFLSLIHI